MRWDGHVERKGGEMYTKFLSECSNERDHSENEVVEGRIILKYTLKKYDVRMRAGFICLRIWSTSGFL
jgi:hypothetical protein